MFQEEAPFDHIAASSKYQGPDNMILWLAIHSVKMDEWFGALHTFSILWGFQQYFIQDNWRVNMKGSAQWNAI